MKTKNLFFYLVGLLCLTILTKYLLKERFLAPTLSQTPKHIVSLAPSITETLYSLGLDQEIAGVTKFCTYPPQVLKKPQVAGFSEINYEAVLRLKPDLIILPQDKIQNKKELENLGLSVLALNTLSMSGLMSSIKELGRVTGRNSEAEEILAHINNSLNEARARANQNEVRVLFSVMHSYQGLGYIAEINVVGNDGFYSELIKAAGGSNVYSGDLAFPRLSREAIIFLNPDVIIDIIPDAEDLEAVQRDWQSLTSVSAIKNNRLYLFTDEADTVPGPRFYQTLAKLSKAFYPERD